MTPLSKLTDTQRVALRRLRENGGEGVCTKNKCVLARGVLLRYGSYEAEGGEPAVEYHDRLTWATFCRLRDEGFVTIEGNRVKVVTP